MKRRERSQLSAKEHKTKKNETRKNQPAYLWEFENFIKERLRALGIIQ